MSRPAFAPNLTQYSDLTCRKERQTLSRLKSDDVRSAVEHYSVLTQINDIEGPDGIGEPGPVLASNNRLVVGAEGAIVGVVHETRVSLVHPDILLP
jgi:hypothetical protein